MFSFINTILDAAAVLIPAVAMIFMFVNMLTMWAVRRNFAVGRLKISQIEFDSKIRYFRLMNIAIAGGAVCFTFGAYFLKSFYAQF